MTMNRKEMIDLVKRLYMDEVGNDSHWLRLILHRPVSHLRDKGYEVTRTGDDEFRVEKGIA